MNGGERTDVLFSQIGQKIYGVYERAKRDRSAGVYIAGDKPGPAIAGVPYGKRAAAVFERRFIRLDAVSRFFTKKL